MIIDCDLALLSVVASVEKKARSLPFKRPVIPAIAPG